MSEPKQVQVEVPICREEPVTEVEDDCDLTSFGLGSAGFLRNNGLDVDFLSEITWNGKIESDEGRSHEQRIDELTYSILYGDVPPEPEKSRKTRRSRSVSPRRVNLENLTLEDRMGPNARFRVRSCGWRPLRGLGRSKQRTQAPPDSRGLPAREPQPPPTPPRRKSTHESLPPLGEPAGSVAESIPVSDTVVTPATSGPPNSDRLPHFIGTHSSPGSDMHHTWTSSEPPPSCPPTRLKLPGAPVWGVPIHQLSQPTQPPAASPPDHIPVAGSSPAPASGASPAPEVKNSGARSPTAECCDLQLVHGDSFEAKPVWAWRFGRGGEWHSVRGCTVELQQATLVVKREGFLQQTLPCVSIAQALTYGSLGRLIIAAHPGVDSLFLSLDKEVHTLVVSALASYGVTVTTVGYAEFFALQKQLVFPGAPIFDAPASSCEQPSAVKKPGKPSKPSQPVQSQGKKSPNAPPPPEKKSPKEETITPGMQAELSKQLTAIRSQQEQLARLEAQLLQLGAAAP